MHIGSAWYPEHWPEARWAEDCRLMRDHGMTVVRVAEFAWSALEPEPGRYDLEWLDRAIAVAAAHGLATVIGTPTATPPAWLTRAEPDILPVREDGRVQPHGQRGHYDPAHPGYRAHAARIAGALAARFGRDPRVIGWQIDNEHWSVGYGPASLAAFRAWLRERYGTLQALNDAWSTRYWSQEFFAWEDIPWPGDYPNPALLLARHRWSSSVTAAFQRAQVDAIRIHAAPHQWITHNFHPHDDLDRWELARDLDFPSWDAYPAIETGIHDLWRDGMDCDRIRGLGDGRLWIMETEPGCVNWQHLCRTLEPGQSRALAWHFVGHGADAVLYWQWRSAPSNQEQHHGTVVDQAGLPRPVAAEIARAAGEIRAAAGALAGTRVATPVAVVDRWLDRTLYRRFKAMRLHGDEDGIGHALAHHRALRRCGWDVAVLDRLGDPAGLRLIVAPRWTHLETADAEALRAWILAGGHLVLGARSGGKDAVGAFHPARQPGAILAPLLGAEVEELYALPSPVPVAGAVAGAGERIGERLRTTAGDTEVVARWGDGHGWLAGTPALVSRRAGAGRISYLAAVPDEALAAAVAGWALAATGLPVHAVDPAVEWCRRTAPDGRQVVIAVNTGARPAVATPGAGWRTILADTVAGSLPPWGVAVWEAG